MGLTDADAVENAQVNKALEGSVAEDADAGASAGAGAGAGAQDASASASDGISAQFSTETVEKGYVEGLRTQLKAAQAKERVSSSVLDAISDIYDALYEVDLTHNSFVEVHATPEISRFCKQYTAADQCVRAVTHALFSPEDIAEVPEFADVHAWANLLWGRRIMSYDLRRGNGRWCRVNLIAAERNSEGDATIVVWASQNIHEQKVVDAEYQQALTSALESAQQANKAKTNFLNSVSHDIRTPMNAIVGYTSLAMTHINNQDQVKNYLGKIITSSNHLLSLINDVLDMSRIESGKVHLNESETSLATLMRDLRNILQTDVAAKQIDFFLDSYDVKDENVICDRLRLSQVLLNVASNSVKYTQPRGSVSIRLVQKQGAPSGYADYAFTVKDTGIGMSKDFLSHVFEPFARAATSTQSGVPGTGLGLTITKNIVELMGGIIEMKSEPGQGTETTLAFRFKKGGSQPVVRPIAQLVNMHALVVDDDMNVCESVTGMLKEIGLRPDWTTSGREALFRARMEKEGGDPFRCYIVDWLMPDMNGLELVRNLRGTIDPDIPIIVLTAYDWAEIEEEARAAGVTAFCSKPLFASQLFDVLRSHVEPDTNFEELIAPVHDFAGAKILLVEDNELNREIAQEVLEDEGFVVESAVNGRLAVEMMNRSLPGEFNMILMDIQMPVMDGYEATRLIRALDRPDARSVPIIALTANAFNEDSERAYEAGMNDYMTKPFHIEDLNAMMVKYLA